ncbi:MAG: aldose 1-epimerase family protein [Lachnospiraceae bacterium]|nr:aldose 1-epimerase family protein [Lachnospiraceae bacterium]
MRYFLENEELKCEFDLHGAELKSVLNKENYREYMWYGNGKYWGRTAPVLFPFVGMLKDKVFSWKGQSYPMGQHGFARDTDFELVSQEGNEIRFVMRSNEETRKKYPFDFTFEIVYTLTGKSLNVRWIVQNTGSEEMHFSIGAHPAFLCPVHGEKNKAGYRLTFKGASEIHHHGNALDTGLSMKEDIVLPLENETAVITEEFFDRTTYMVEGGQTQDVVLSDPEGKPIVEVVFDAPLFGVWSPEKKNAPFVCIEPWYGRCDAEDFDGDLSEREYSNKLLPGETFDKNYTITYYTL